VLLGALGLVAAGAAHAEPHYLIVAGLGGEPRYESAFTEHAEALANAARRTAGDDSRIEVLRGDDATAEALRAAFHDLASGMEAADSLIVFLVGHGSYDGERYKLNLKGPDLDGKELGELLAGVPARSQLIVNATSASGAVLEEWAADGRIVVTATRSGAERNATRFAEHWADALSSAEADVDKNGTVSAQEAFDYASRKVAESYESEGTLATEHPQLAGDAAARFTVARLTDRPTLTPQLQGLTARLVELENDIEALRLRRDDMEPDAYLNELQNLLVQLARVQQEIDAAGGDSGTADPAGDGSGADSREPQSPERQSPERQSTETESTETESTETESTQTEGRRGTDIPELRPN
jgi:hypothetical protein